MPDIKKPAFPAVSAGTLTQKLDDVRNTLARATTQGADGRKTVSVATLTAEAKATNDPVLKKALEAIVDGFVTYRPSERVSGACGGPVNERVMPPTLDEAQLTEVSRALDQARSRLTAVTGADGVLQREEADAPRFGTGLAANLSRAVIDGVKQPWESSLREWVSKVAETAYKVESRVSVNEGIERLAAHHGDSSLGQDAIRWAFRGLTTSPNELFSYDQADKKLRKAESSWLARVPFFGGGVENAAGHLSDAEVKKMLGTDDLAGFIAQKKSEVDARTQGGWDGFIAGKDLPNSQHVSDPDVQVSSRC